MRDKRILTSLCALCWACVAQGADLQLTRDGKAEYEIVQPDEPSDVDEYAVKALASFLRDKTGGIAFSPVATGLAAITESLVRNFGRTYENVYSFYLARPQPGAPPDTFACDWLVGMTRS